VLLLPGQKDSKKGVAMKTWDEIYTSISNYKDLKRKGFLSFKR
jgi:hypothetical protein